MTFEELEHYIGWKIDKNEIVFVLYLHRFILRFYFLLEKI